MGIILHIVFVVGVDIVHSVCDVRQTGLKLNENFMLEFIDLMQS